MASRIQPDMTPPTVTSFTPDGRQTGVNAGGSVTAKFSEPMQSWKRKHSTFKLKDPAGNAVPATVSYNSIYLYRDALSAGERSSTERCLSS